MHYTGQIYRPPFEARTTLLQVTEGCSHNACTFCTMYKGVPFKASPMEDIREDLEELEQQNFPIRRIFLENGDAFALPTERLLEILGMIHEYLPTVRTVTGYASIKNIRRKSVEEIRALREAGYNQPNIGLESALDSVLEHFNKGYIIEDARKELKKMREAGMEFSLNFILGAEGHGNYRESAERNAAFANETKPFLVYTGSLHYAPGCRIYEEIADGSFPVNTLGELMEEQKLFLKQIELPEVPYFGLHPSNPVRLSGILPYDRERLISAIEQAKQKFSPAELSLPPERSGGEGFIV